MRNSLVEIKRSIYRGALRFTPYKMRLAFDYLRKYKRIPNLHLPTLHSERMLRRVLYEDTSLMTQLCSKQDMKKIAKQKIGNADIHIAKTFWFGSREKVPEAVEDSYDQGQNWVLKPNNLGGGIIMFPEPEWGVKELEERTERLLKTSHRTTQAYRFHAPTAWRASRPGFLIEERIGGKDWTPDDYKVHVFHGIPKILSVYTNRASRITAQHFDITGRYLFGRNDHHATNLWPEREASRLFSAATLLSCDLPYTRVDFYVEEDRIWFGEISPFGSMDGLEGEPLVDQQMGLWWTAPEC